MRIVIYAALLMLVFPAGTAFAERSPGFFETHSGGAEVVPTATAEVKAVSGETGQRVTQACAATCRRPHSLSSNGSTGRGGQ